MSKKQNIFFHFHRLIIFDAKTLSPKNKVYLELNGLQWECLSWMFVG